MLAVSVDSVYSHKIFSEREGYEFPLLSDFWPHGAVAQAYGVFNEQAGIANRGTFLVDKDGIVRFAEMNGPGEGRDADDWRGRSGALVWYSRWLHSRGTSAWSPRGQDADLARAHRVTGRVAQPRRTRVGRRVPSPAVRRSGKRSNRLRRPTSPSSRARAAPRQ